MHPQRVMGKRSSPCGRTDKAVEVEDHGNGFMFVGCSDIAQARRLLVEYVDDAEPYAFAALVLQRLDAGRLACGVWLTTGPSEVWEGATDPTGKAVPRSLQ